MAQVRKRMRSAEIQSVVVIEPNRQMQHLLRAMLATYGIRSVKVFAETELATAAMLADPPRLVLLDWTAGPLSGARFLKLFRHRNMMPLSLVPIIVTTSTPTQSIVERALRLGANAVLSKPLSPIALMEHIRWVISDERPPMRLIGERFVIEGMADRLDVEKERQDQLESAREYQAQQLAAMDEIQSDVDRILRASF